MGVHATVYKEVETIAENELKAKPRGRVTRTAAKKEYDLVEATTRKGGRVVRVMPRGLQKIKEAQESQDGGQS